MTFEAPNDDIAIAVGGLFASGYWNLINGDRQTLVDFGESLFDEETRYAIIDRMVFDRNDYEAETAKVIEQMEEHHEEGGSPNPYDFVHPVLGYVESHKVEIIDAMGSFLPGGFEDRKGHKKSIKSATDSEETRLEILSDHLICLALVTAAKFSMASDYKLTVTI